IPVFILSVPQPRCCFFFFQAEDGIRDFHVTGVQTCALPIWASASWPATSAARSAARARRARVPGQGSICSTRHSLRCVPVAVTRSEERRVGKERSARRTPYRGRENYRGSGIWSVAAKLRPYT